MTDSNNHDLTLSRVLNAPLNRVWSAWTDPSELKNWWGPRGVTNPTCEWNAVSGGNINVVMLAGKELGAMEGQEWPMTGKFKEVIPNQKLVFTSEALADGKPILETLCTLTLEGMKDKTKITLEIKVTKVTPQSEGPLAGMSVGWNQSLDKLEDYL